MPPTDNTNYLRCVQEWSWTSGDESEIFEEVGFGEGFEDESEEEEEQVVEALHVEEIEEIDTPKTRWSVDDLEMERTSVCKTLSFKSNVCRRLRFESEDENK